MLFWFQIELICGHCEKDEILASHRGKELEAPVAMGISGDGRYTAYISTGVVKETRYINLTVLEYVAAEKKVSCDIDQRLLRSVTLLQQKQWYNVSACKKALFLGFCWTWYLIVPQTKVQPVCPKYHWAIWVGGPQSPFSISTFSFSSSSCSISSSKQANKHKHKQAQVSSKILRTVFIL